MTTTDSFFKLVRTLVMVFPILRLLLDGLDFRLGTARVRDCDVPHKPVVRSAPIAAKLISRSVAAKV
jgi:hypothetical protein